MNESFQGKAYPVNIWGNIDFATVKQRIDRVTNQIEEVIQKYELPGVVPNDQLPTKTSQLNSKRKLG